MSERTMLNFLPESKTDWKKIRELTDEQIDMVCAGDEDIIFSPSNKNMVPENMLYPDGIIIRNLPVELRIDNWLREHELQADKVAATLLKQFVEAQMQADKAEKK